MMYGAPNQFGSPSKASSAPLRALAELRRALSASSGTKLSVMAAAVVVAAALALTSNPASPTAPPQAQRATIFRSRSEPRGPAPLRSPQGEARALPADVAVDAATPEARAEPGNPSAVRGPEMLAPLILTAQPPASVRPEAAQDDGDLPAASLVAEPLLLQHAADALATGEPELALSMLQTHRTRFVRSRLREQRDGLIALARCTLDGRDLHFAQRYLERYPTSELSVRVRQTCALQSVASQARPRAAVDDATATSDTSPLTGLEGASEQPTTE